MVGPGRGVTLGFRDDDGSCCCSAFVSACCFEQCHDFGSLLWQLAVRLIARRVFTAQPTTRGLHREMALQPLLLLVCVLFLASPVRTVAQAPQPKWYRRFTVSFNESTKILFRRNTVGTWYYDADMGAEVVEREDGNGDRYCGSIHPIQHTSCRHVVVNGNRYLVFPDLGECCLCCTAEHGCGILSPDWLASGSYEGEDIIRDIPVHKWVVKGLQDNIYYSTADKRQLPVELDQVPNDNQSFDLESFSQDPIPVDLLQIPPDCHMRCPISSVCTILREKGMRATAATAEAR